MARPQLHELCLDRVAAAREVAYDGDVGRAQLVELGLEPVAADGEIGHDSSVGGAQRVELRLQAVALRVEAGDTAGQLATFLLGRGLQRGELRLHRLPRL